jgi:3-hydroxyacyl-[acyl-carrier-protein] dehydratase
MVRLFKRAATDILHDLSSLPHWNSPRDLRGIPSCEGYQFPRQSKVTVRFSLVDKIVALQPGASIEAIKGLSMAEEYLQDHFPRFPVMPGVLMLEALYQSAAWLVRASEDFQHSIVLLKEARNVKYGSFVKPGQTLRIEANIIKHEPGITSLKGQAFVGEETAVSARLVLERFNLAERRPTRAASDEIVLRGLRQQFRLLYAGPISTGPISTGPISTGPISTGPISTGQSAI